MTENNKNQIPVSEGTKRMLNLVKDEFFPITNEIKELLIEIQKIRIKIPIFSKKLNNLEKEYEDVSKRFYSVVKKLETPDDLFEGLESNQQDIVGYFQFQKPIANNINSSSKYIEIIDRTLDRKKERIQNFRTLVLAIVAIVISVFL
jgi:chromosome segregation ATPase